MSNSWFYKLFGTHEENNAFESVKEGFHLSVDKQVLTSLANNKQHQIGTFETVTLEELRDRGRACIPEPTDSTQTTTTYNHIKTSDIFSMHYEFPNATFQAASQFNCLEFSSAQTTPEKGVTRYQFDLTQGPACAISCGAGTVYRNYFTPVQTKQGEFQFGQTKSNQINNLDVLETFLDNDIHKYWYVENGYTFSRGQKHLIKLSKHLATHFNSTEQRNVLLSKIKVGVHANVGVNFKSRYNPVPETEDVRVTQVYTSALSCTYSGIQNKYWTPLGKKGPAVL